MVNCDRLCLQYMSTVTERLVIPLSLGDCSTATNKAAYTSRNNDHVSHMAIVAKYTTLLWSLLITP